MSRLLHVASFASLLVGVTPAFAQAPGPVASPPAAPAPTPAPPGAVAVSPSPVPPPPGAPHAADCLIGNYPSEYPDSARTATGLVCDALRARGVDVGAPSLAPEGAPTAYVVSLDQLGSTFFLRVDYQEPAGRIRVSRKALLYDLSEADVAAPRLAAALTGGATVEQTQRYENVVGAETRPYEKRWGEFVIGGGIAGVSLPVGNVLMAPTVNLFAFYETARWGIGLQLHLRDADDSSFQKASLNALSVGGRYYFNDENVTPLVGGGLSIATITEYEDRPDGTAKLNGNGTTAYAEVGVEVFRLHSTHLIATLRVDAPFFSLQRDNQFGCSYYGTTCAQTTGTKERYDVPISLNVGIGF